MCISEKQQITTSNTKTIILDETTVIKQYRTYLDFDTVCAYYETHYHLSEPEFFRIRKEIHEIIHNHFDIHTLPDPYFIYQDATLLAYSLKQNMQASIYVENIVKRLIQTQEHSPKFTLSYFQDQLDFDMKAFLVEMYITYALLKPMIQDVLKQDTYIQQLLHAFSQDQEFHSDLQAALLTCYGASADSQHIYTKCNTMLQQYPKEPYFVYFSLVHGLMISNHIPLLTTYYKEAIQYQATTPLEQSFQQQLTQLYNMSMQQKETINEHTRFN